jgi:DNA-directed RNA polymerase subunit RPC12/RpoP
LKGVKQELLQQIIEFIYIGEVKLCESEVDSFVELGKELEVEGLADYQLEEVQGDALATEELAIPKLVVDSFLEERLEEDMDSEFSFEEIAIAETEIEPSEIDAAPPKKKIKQEKDDAEQNIDGKDKRYSCLQCDFASEHHVSLKKHRLSKHESVRYQCERCERSYTDSSALLRHKKSVHDGFVYKCETCDKHFSEAGALTRHKKNIHSAIN